MSNSSCDKFSLRIGRQRNGQTAQKISPYSNVSPSSQVAPVQNSVHVQVKSVLPTGVHVAPLLQGLLSHPEPRHTQKKLSARTRYTTRVK